MKPLDTMTHEEVLAELGTTPEAIARWRRLRRHVGARECRYPREGVEKAVAILEELAPPAPQVTLYEVRAEGRESTFSASRSEAEGRAMAFNSVRQKLACYAGTSEAVIVERRAELLPE